MDYLIQTKSKYTIGPEADVKKLLSDIAKSEKPVRFAIFRIAGLGNIQPMHVVFVRGAGGYVEDRFGNMMFNF